MAEELELDPQDAEDVQIEILPEPEEERPRMQGKDTRTLDVRDEEISGYGKGVQDRIKKLRFAFHEERRLREQSQRDQTTANDLAQRLFKENTELKKSVRAGEQAVVQQAIHRAESEIANAKAKSRAAYETGQADEIVTANAELARAVAEKDRLSILQMPPEEEKPAPTRPAQQPTQDEATQRWMARNPWYGKPGEEERTALALGVHNRLTAQGVNPATQPDLYWRTIDERLKAVFPDKTEVEESGDVNGTGGANGNGHRTTTSRPLAVAGGTRSNTGATAAGRARVIQLSASQVRLARRIGITPEQYAQQLLLEEREAAANA